MEEDEGIDTVYKFGMGHKLELVFGEYWQTVVRLKIWPSS